MVQAKLVPPLCPIGEKSVQPSSTDQLNDTCEYWSAHHSPALMLTPLGSEANACNHAGYICSRAKNNTIINTQGKKGYNIRNWETGCCDYRSTMQRVKTQNALVVPRTMATSHFDHSKSFRPYWENIIACSYGLLELSQVANRFERSIEAISRKFG